MLLRKIYGFCLLFQVWRLEDFEDDNEPLYGEEGISVDVQHASGERCERCLEDIP